MEKISQMSLLEVAVMLMEQKRAPQSIRALIKEVLEMKGLDDEDSTLAAQLYIDLTTSSKFVYMGNEEWDLKSRQSLDEYDKDGSAFNSKEDLEDLEEDELEDELDEVIDDEDDDDDYLDDEDDDDDYLDDDDDEDDDDEDDDEDDLDDEDEDSIIDDDLVERYDEDVVSFKYNWEGFESENWIEGEIGKTIDVSGKEGTYTIYVIVTKEDGTTIQINKELKIDNVKPTVQIEDINEFFSGEEYIPPLDESYYAETRPLTPNS